MKIHLWAGIRTLTIFVVFFIALSVQAKVYKWIDKDGKVHYSDKPVDGKGQPIKIEKQPSAKQVSEAKKRAAAIMRHKNRVQELVEDDLKKQTIKELKEEKNNKEMNALCRQAKSEIIKLSRGYRVFEEDTEGKRKFLSDDEKNAEIKRLEIAIKEHCKM